MRNLLAILAFTLISCSHNVDEPSNLLSEDKMKSIITDLLLYQQTNYVAHAEIGLIDYAKMNTFLISNHGATVKEFEESYTFYISHPDRYNKLLLEIRHDLEQRLPEAERIKREKIRENPNQ